MIRRISGLRSGGGQAAKIGDHREDIVIAEFAGIGVGHHDQPTSVPIDAVANGAENLAIRPVTQLAGGSEVRGYERPDRHRKIFTDVEAAGKRAGS